MVFPGVPVATLTYATDIAPHLERALRFRRQRMHRWQVLHARDACEDEYDPYAWAKTDRTFRLFFGVVAIVGYAVGCEMTAWFKRSVLGR
jgi:hypothetical protein